MGEDDLRCSGCGRPFEGRERVALISGKVMGDECTDAYYLCEACGVYTVRLYRDVFLGEEISRDSSPISREEGDRRVGLINSCAEPWNERCTCDAHREYFGGWLD
ncbi:MAG: hypothetical protein MUO50_02305 [Longimicrobiales bacterium]|nr:hypothetical protein [Longimicrobiales bacterium]